MTWIDREDEFKQASDLKSLKRSEMQESQYSKPFSLFVKSIKKQFAAKYNLNLRKIEVELLDHEGVQYLLDVKEILLEKYDNRDIKLKSEKMISNFNEKYRHKNLFISKEASNIAEVKMLLGSMHKAYEGVQKSFNIDIYLKASMKSQESDIAFKQLRPKCPFEFSELLSGNIDKITFAKHCSNNLFVDKFDRKE